MIPFFIIMTTTITDGDKRNNVFLPNFLLFLGKQKKKSVPHQYFSPLLCFLLPNYAS